MKKIISLFQRNYETDRMVRNEVVPGAEWVQAGEGIATRKWNGACCKVENGLLYKRYDAKHGKKAPVGFIPAQEKDEVTGHQPGWLLVGDRPEDKHFRTAFVNYMADHNGQLPVDGTYEACGPHFQGNAEHLAADTLIRHGGVYICDVPRTFDELKSFFMRENMKSVEGVVWWHPDGRMVKIKKKDFGIK